MNPHHTTPEPTQEEVKEAMTYLRKLIFQKFIALIGIALPFLLYRAGEGTGLILSLIFLPCFVYLLFCKHIVVE